MPSSVQAYETDASRQDPSVRLLREGTRIKIVKLIKTPLDSSTPYHPYGEILDGPFRGRRAEIGSILIEPRIEIRAPGAWSLDPENLADCPETNGVPGE
jgi:hypothetical protein